MTSCIKSTDEMHSEDSIQTATTTTTTTIVPTTSVTTIDAGTVGQQVTVEKEWNNRWLGAI